MDNKLDKLKRRINSIDPVIRKTEIDLNVAQIQLSKSKKLYDESLIKEKSILDNKNKLLIHIQERFGDINDINVQDMINIRNYLTKLEDDMVLAKKDVQLKSNKVESDNNVVMYHHINKKLYERAYEASEKQLINELDKVSMSELDNIIISKEQKE